MDAKKIAIPVILVVGLGVSIYLGTRFLGSDDDPVLMGQIAEFTCPACGTTFSMTVEESRDQLRKHGSILCKQCGEGGVVQQNVRVRVGGPSGFAGDRDRQPDEIEEDPQPIPGGGIQPVGG